MKRFIKTALTVVLAAAAVSCAKELEPQKEKINGTFDLSITGVINGYTPQEETKAEAQTVVRIMWKGGEKVYVFDGTECLGSLTASIEGTDGTYAKLTGTIEGTTATTLTFVYSPQFSETQAPAVTDGKISLDLSVQDDAEVPFLIYATLPTDQAPAAFSNDVVQFNLATSVFKCNCTGLVGDDDISKAVISGVNTKCELTLSDSGVPTIDGTTPGTITRTETAEPSVFTQADQRAIFSVAVVKTDASAERNILVHQGSKVSGASFTTATLAAGKSYNTVYQMCEYIAPPAGVLPGGFTVNAQGKKVHFSKGNLYAKKESGEWKWHFYDEQYQYNSIPVDNSGKRTATDGDTEIDLFTWGYNATYSIDPIGYDYVTGHSIHGETFTKNEDWGYVFGGESSVWRTLTWEEWMYLFAWTESGSNTDTGSPRYNRHKLGVKICGKENCMVLLPDNWDETVISLTNFASQMEYNENSAPTWAEMAEAGAVCLPAAGQRHGPEVTECDSKSYYWSSSALDMSLIGITDDAAAYVTFDGSEVWVGAYPGFYGYSVRLVTESSDGYSPTEKVTGVSLNKNATTIKVGAQETLVATVLPANAANKDVIWSSNNVDVAIVDNTGKVTAVSPGTAVISVVADGFFSATCTVTVQPADILCGTFKVGNYSYVRFAPGNLQAIWDGSAYRWFFAANQFDCIGDASGNRTIDSPSVGDIVDLFGWSTPATNFGISTSSRSGFDANDYSGVFKDWGIAHGNSNGLLEDYEQWRTLSRDEWVYLLGPAIENFGTDFPDKPYRENAENLCSIATVCGKVCLVVAPDYCTDEEFDKNKTTYSATEWADAEANGIVCIAITCARYGNEVENESWANYWTSTSQTDYTAEYLYFKINDSSPIIKTQQASRVCGYSVRLVRDCG